MTKNASLRLVGMLLGLLVLAVLVHIALSGDQDGSLQRVRQAGVLVVALDASYPPFETTDGQGNFSGFDVDVAAELAHRLGVRLQIANTAFDSLYDALAARRADVVVSGLRYERERTRDVFYTIPYFDAGHVLLVRADDTITRTAALSGRSVGVEWASEGEVEAKRLAAKLPGLEVCVYETLEKAVLALIRGEVDATIADHVLALAAARHHTGIRLVLPPFAPDPLVVAGHSEDRMLMREINRLIAALRDEGVLSQLAERWFSQSATGGW